MHKEIDYSQYTLEELFDVQRVIDKEHHPERYQSLIKEIESRKLTPEYIKEKCKHDFITHREKYDDDYDYEDIVELQHQVGQYLSNHKWLMVLLAAVFVTINVGILNVLISNNSTLSLKDIHVFQTQLDDARCRKEVVYLGDTDNTKTYFDLVLNSYPHEFVALNVTEKTCKKILRKVLPTNLVEIGHVDGLIHQLKFEDKVLLSYQFMKPKVISYKNSKSDGYLFWLIITWAIIAPCLFFSFSSYRKS